METSFSLDLVVAATDFSDSARAAFRTALDLATRSGAALRLLHVEHPSGGDFRRYTPGAETAIGATRIWAHDAAPATRLDAVSFEAVALDDDAPASAVLKYADKVGVDLLVVGTHGRRGLSRWLLGSVSERIIRFSPCPVLAVPEENTGVRPGAQPVLAAIDFSSATPDVLAWAKRIATLYDAPLDLVHIVAEAMPMPHFYPTLQRPPLRSILDIAPDLDQRACEEMERALASAPGPRVEARCHVRMGTPSKEVTALAREREAALIVMGTQGLAGVELLVLGSTAARTVRTAPCAVLTTRRPEVEDPETGEAVSRSALATV